MKTGIGKRSICFLLTLLLVLLPLSGCANVGAEMNEQGTVVVEQAQALNVDTTPVVKEGGGKFRIGMVDIDEYEPASIYFYYFLQGLKSIGWIEFDTLPFTATSMDVKAMMVALSEMDLGPYIEFVGDATHYLAYEDHGEIEQNLRKHIASDEGLDLILAMGTDPGLFVKPLNLGIPSLVCMATDPVMSGIIDSAEHSGNDYIWAQVEPQPYYRQIKFYHNTLPFENIGMVYSDPIVAGIPDYENGAAELGISITKVQIDEQRSQTDEEVKAYSDMLVSIYEKMIAENGIDAYMLNADLISSNVPLEPLLKPFQEAGIPVFVQDGENYVREGALMLVASTDNQGVGHFVAQVAARVFKGEKAGDIPCEYVSSPYMSINLDTAKAISFRPSFEMLLSCETIYTSENQENQ